jgi:shikimate kinase/3-dehydroquinate synthase
MRENIFLTGFSGTGKSTVGRAVARLLGWRFVDTDELIVEATGKSIPAIFEEGGEAAFRRLEHEHLTKVCEAERQIVSTGGGIVMDDRNRRLMETSGIVVCLEAGLGTIHRRILAEDGQAIRPMLSDPDPLRRIGALKAERQAGYARALWTVHTDRLTPEEAAGEVARAYRILVDRIEGTPSPQSYTSKGERAGNQPHVLSVRTMAGDYPVWVGWGNLAQLGGRVREIVGEGAAYVVTDAGASAHAAIASESMKAARVPVQVLELPSGEGSKTLDTARRIYGWLASCRAERGDLVVAVGGGVVGDVAGFAAATYLRGMRFAQVPTTLLAMMDSSIGGKTGVDLSEGKNLVGAFHQPQFVLDDIRTLQTLPERDRISGWAEAIKHGLIADERLLRSFEDEGEAIRSLEGAATTEVIARSVAIKADVVSRDERETLGLRVLLNYGHTIAHALEAATGYEKYLHGEAVSIGMMGAAAVCRGLDMLTDADVDRQRRLLEAYGLPVRLDQTGLEGAISAVMALDKKTMGGAIRWVLLDGIGHAVTRADVPSDLVDEALRGLCP